MLRSWEVKKVKVNHSYRKLQLQRHFTSQTERACSR